MDLNIFFSSLAQSVGGLVGIFAAFIITKIVNNQSEFDKRMSQIRDEINAAEFVADKLGSFNFDFYNRTQQMYQMALVGDDVNSGRAKAPEIYYRDLKFPRFVPRHEILAAVRARIQQGRQMLPNTALYNQELRTALSDDGEKINNLLVESQHQVRTAKALAAKVRGNPESSTLVTISVIATLLLFYAGLIYPLSFLPIEPGQEIHLSLSAFFSLLTSLRGLLLFIPSSIFTMTMATFFVMNWNLTYTGKNIEELIASTKLEYYSKFFKQMLENEKENEKWARESNPRVADVLP